MFSGVSMFVKPIALTQHKASLLLHCQPASFTVEREKGGFEMRADRIHINIDSTEMRSSIGLKNNTQIREMVAEKGRSAVLEATARYGEEAQIMIDPDSGGIDEVISRRMTNNMETMLAFIPETGPHISWEGGTTQIHYTPDRLHIEWKLGGVEKQYVPYSLTFSASPPGGESPSQTGDQKKLETADNNK